MIVFVWDTVEFWLGLLITALARASRLQQFVILASIARDFRAAGWL